MAARSSSSILQVTKHSLVCVPAAQKQVEEARAALEQDKVAAQERLQAESARMAAEIIRQVLRPVSGSVEEAR